MHDQCNNNYKSIAVWNTVLLLSVKKNWAPRIYAITPIHFFSPMWYAHICYMFHQHFQLSMTSKQLKDAASHAKTTKAWRPHQAVQHEYRIWHKQQLSWVVFFCHFDIFTSIFNTILYSIGIFLGLLDISYLFPIRIRKSQELSFELTIIDPKYCYLRKDTNITLLFNE